METASFGVWVHRFVRTSTDVVEANRVPFTRLSVVNDQVEIITKTPPLTLV